MANKTSNKVINVKVSFSGNIEEKFKGVQKAVKNTTKELSTHSKAVDATFKNVAAGVAAGNFAFAAFSKAVDFATGIVRGFISIGSRLAEKAFEIGKRVVLVGAEFKTLSAVARNTAKNLKMKKEFDQLIKGLADTNTFGSNAIKVADTFVRSGLIPMVKNLKRTSKATGKVTKGVNAFVLSAKDLAAAAGISSSEGIDNLVRAINRLDPALLETMGIQVNLTQLWKTNEKRLKGLSGAELVRTQRLLLLNAVMKEAEKVTGAYDVANQSAAKNIRSLGDLQSSLTEELGARFEPILAGVTGNLVKMGKAFRTQLLTRLPEVDVKVKELISTFGQLAFGFRLNVDDITESGKTLADVFAEALKFGLEFAEQFLVGFSSKIPDIQVELLGLEFALKRVAEMLGITLPTDSEEAQKSLDDTAGAAGRAAGEAAGGGIAGLISVISEFLDSIDQNDIDDFKDDLTNMGDAAKEVKDFFSTLNTKTSDLDKTFKDLRVTLNIVAGLINIIASGLPAIQAVNVGKGIARLTAAGGGHDGGLIQGYQTGGIVKGPTIGPGRDNVLIRAERKEAVVTEQGQRNLLKAIESGDLGGGGGGLTINNMTVVSNDPVNFMEQMRNMQARKNVLANLGQSTRQ